MISMELRPIPPTQYLRHRCDQVLGRARADFLGTPADDEIRAYQYCTALSCFPPVCKLALGVFVNLAWSDSVYLQLYTKGFFHRRCRLFPRFAADTSQ